MVKSLRIGQSNAAKFKYIFKKVQRLNGQNLLINKLWYSLILYENIRINVSKSFISILAGYLRCMFLPNSKYFICAPGKEQGAKIAKEKFDELFQKFPMLKNEYVKYNSSNDYVTIVFKNGSVFDVVGALNSTRGGRRNGGIIDEIRDHDGTTLTEIVLPLMNVDRRDAQGDVDPTEPN